MDEHRFSSAFKALVRVALAIGIFAVLAPAPASSGTLVKVCPAVRAISV